MSRYTFSASFATEAIDLDAGLIRGVSVITEGPALGHGVMIDAASLASVVECASAYRGGLKVKMNHGTGADAIVGVLRNFRIDSESELQCVRADLQLLKSSSLRSLILEMSMEMPDSFGLSISFSGVVEEIEKEQYVRCLEIYSCDIVDSPAANPNGLFAALVDTNAEAMDAIALAQELELARETTAAAQAQAQKNFADYQAQAALVVSITAERDGLAEKLGKVSDEFSALAETNIQLSAKLEAAQNDLAAKINEGITRELAKAGHAPIEAEVIADPAAKQPKPEAFGLARVIQSLQKSDK